ncbi:hypothetical protein R3P38DRAFT_3335295 [Favolaschia claudopus]|uniref:Uncharacterized protein n=1 Tax=Favolaschia claudopus TaxID=2862362 RepID=A0AAV9ZB31_9AGAR
MSHHSFPGGSTRGQVYGTGIYGSGYPGFHTRGVEGRWFPFYFWPLVWGPGPSYSAYLRTDEYGQPSSTSRPGGVMTEAVFQSSGTGTIFRLVAHSGATAPSPFNGNTVHAEQVVQYYRASSVALTLDTYNDTAIFLPENSTSQTPLPAGVDQNLLTCLNLTIGQAVPLVDVVSNPDVMSSSRSRSASATAIGNVEMSR